MAHQHRFYVGEDLPSSGRCTLREEEAHHAVRVVRVRVGDRVALFDGAGREALAVVVEARGSSVCTAIESVIETPEPAVRVELVQAWLHRDRAIEELIRRCVDIGVDRFRFFRGRRSERPLRDDGGKWTRIAVEVCKQCGRNRLPSFGASASLAEALEAQPRDGRLLAASQDEAPTPFRHALDGVRPGESVALVIGPEGDFAPDELCLLREHGAVWVSLGRTTFRAEVAAALGAALVRYELGDLGPI